MSERGVVLGHPWVTGEIALGHLSRRRSVLGLLRRLPSAVVATPDEILVFVERHDLAGTGIGYVDVQLLTATRLTSDARLWARDKRLAASALRLGLAVDPAGLSTPAQAPGLTGRRAAGPAGSE